MGERDWVPPAASEFCQFVCDLFVLALTPLPCTRGKAEVPVVVAGL